MPPRKSPSDRSGVEPTPTTPQDYPRSTPPLSSVDHSWVLQTTIEMQKSLGQLSQSISDMRADIKEHGEKLAKFERILYAVSVVGALLVVVGGFLINKLWDPVVAALMQYAKTQP